MAFDLGDCDGVRTYRKISTFFPQHGERFDPSLYIDLCTGSTQMPPGPKSGSTTSCGLMTWMGQVAVPG